MKIWYVILFVALSLSCSKRQDDVALEVDLMPLPEGSAKIQAPQDPLQRTQKLIKTGTIEFATTDALNTRTTILASLSKHGGYLANDQQQTLGERVSYTLVVRIPAARFDTFLSDATKGVQQFDEKQIKVQDVTAQFTDDSLQLATKRKIETRYLQLLARANNVNDILNIEKALGEIRTDIERIEGSQKVLSHQIKYSSLTITFYDQSASKLSFLSQIAGSFHDGWRYIKSFTISLISLWPFILLTILIIWLTRYWKNRIKLRKSAKSTD